MLSGPKSVAKSLQNELRDFRLGGAELAPEQKARFKKIRERESQVSTRFSENVLDATNAFALYVDDASALAGVPEDALQMLSEVSARRRQDGLQDLAAVSELFGDRRLRARPRAAPTDVPRLFDQGIRIRQSGLEQRPADGRAAEAAARARAAARIQELCRSVAWWRKWQKARQHVLEFLRDLARRAKPYAERDIGELREFAAKHLGIADLQPWDVSYASEKLREQRYSYSEQELKQYFTEPRVLAGLFKVIETLFAVAIRQEAAPVWHPDVRFYRIENLHGQLVGQFYLDLYARDHKQGGAWQGDARSRRARRTALATPVSFLTCNFSRPAGGKPATLKHDEVLTLFHEFGHGLHHMLTRVDEPSVSGIQGVEWDAVELPSQFMENFAWEWEVLQMLTGHVDTGEKLPRPLFEKMLAAKNFQSGMFTRAPARVCPVRHAAAFGRPNGLTKRT